MERVEEPQRESERKTEEEKRERIHYSGMAAGGCRSYHALLLNAPLCEANDSQAPHNCTRMWCCAAAQCSAETETEKEKKKMKEKESAHSLLPWFLVCWL